MVIKDLIRENFVMIYELIGLLIMLRISVHVSERTKRLTVAVVILLLAEVVIFRLQAWTETFEQLSPARPFLAAADYTIYPFILILVMLITTKGRLKGKKLLLMMIPAVVSVPVYFTSPWTRLVFYFSEDNTFHGGPLHYWAYFVFAFYCAVFLIQNFIYFKKYPGFSRIASVYIILGPIVGVFLYLFVLDYSSYSTLFSTALLLYYLCIYIHTARIDPLTLLMNRQSYYQDINTRAVRITGVVSVDMNELKYLNDTFGHEAGDKALRAVSEILVDNSGRGTVYRVGGDEFIILYFDQEERELISAIKRMREKLAETEYSCAFGYAMKGALDHVDDAVTLADSRMY